MIARRQGLKPSLGTQWPPEVKASIRERDGSCVGPMIGMPGACAGPLDPDHVRASGGLGMKSPSVESNGVLLCRWVHHPMKTERGRTWRPPLLDYLAKFYEVVG